jgi:hypothetical protein
MKLWIDDERSMPEGYTHMAMSSAQAISLLEHQRYAASGFQLVSFDHDLGGTFVGNHLIEDTSRPVLTWMIENDMWPDEIRIHTINPVGREWLEGTAKRYAPKSVLILPPIPYRASR